MKRIAGIVFFGAVGLLGLGASVSQTACSPSLAQPYAGLKDQPITIFRLQNWEPPEQAAAQPGAAPVIPGMPPQIQQWLNGAAAALPPGLIPPGLLPGATPFTPAANAPRFYGFRIIGTTQIADPKLRDEVLEIFGKESNFQNPTQSCMYPEMGFQIGQPPPAGTPQGAPVSSPPADILVSTSCDSVRLNNYAWPFGGKTAMGPDTRSKLLSVFTRAFGG